MKQQIRQAVSVTIKNEILQFFKKGQSIKRKWDLPLQLSFVENNCQSFNAVLVKAHSIPKISTHSIGLVKLFARGTFLNCNSIG